MISINLREIKVKILVRIKISQLKIKGQISLQDSAIIKNKKGMLKSLNSLIAVTSAVSIRISGEGPGFCKQFRHSQVFFGGEILVDEQICFDDCLLAGGQIQHQYEKGENGAWGLSADEFLDQYWCEIDHNDCLALKEWRAGLFECDVGCVASGGKIKPGSNQCDHGDDNEDCLFPVILNEG